MYRYFKKMMVQMKIESTYGVDPGGWAATDFVLLSDVTFKIDRDLEPRKLIRGFMGGSEQLAGSRQAMIDFTVELAGSGAAGTAPAWGKILRILGAQEAITAGSRVEYSPVSESFASATVRYFIDGLMYVSRGVRGTGKGVMNAYGRPELSVSLKGFDTNAQEVAMPSQTLTAWKQPEVITDANSGDIVMGGTYSTGAITVGAGAILPSHGLEFDIGNTVDHAKLLGAESIHISNRESTGKIKVLLSAAQEVLWRSDINANVLTTLAFRHGSAAGKQIIFWSPSVQRVDPQIVEYQGLALMEAELRFLPESGNDEWKICVK